ncbi:MAG TPA: class I SAM-dependent methyltransferase [Verrucomicrobiae bacterium]|jgi:ubiquinone/menaquinone biosynthesis C-methylase UbiE
MEPEESYFSAEWEKFRSDPERSRQSLAAVAGLRMSKVLDVGCGAGQELLPFVTSLGAYGVGVDISSTAMQIARQKFEELGYSERVEFHYSPAEALPFASNSFDLVTCRLALPYTVNQLALSEMARVLCPAGILILKIHAPLYYLRKGARAVTKRDFRVILWTGRIILASTLYHLTGTQPDNRLLKREAFQTPWMLRRVLSSVGLVILHEVAGASKNAGTPTSSLKKAPRLQPAGSMKHMNNLINFVRKLVSPQCVEFVDG